jgi:two-component system chemotaxis response regulator CheB
VPSAPAHLLPNEDVLKVDTVPASSSGKTPPPKSGPIRLLVVDDSAYNRRNIAEVFAAHPEVEVVGRAADGEEALRLATSLKPDVITLDLEMPRMDGFTFLRILMSKQPTPVIVVSSYSQKENVFKALELGALDFVAKPDRQISPDAVEVRDQILAKVLLVRSLRPTFAPSPNSARRPTSGAWSSDGRPRALDAPPSSRTPLAAPKYLVAIASSTGGPSALLELFGRLPLSLSAAFVIAQHMPDKFTRAFAERLDRRGAVRTNEGQDGDVLAQRTGFVCPGRQCMEVVEGAGQFRIRVVAPTADDRYVPSADRLFRSVAKAVGSRAIGVVLTGMGDDGLEGARAIRAAGGLVVAESAETAVVYGMPGAVARAGAASKVLPLGAIGEWLGQLPA